MEVMTHIYFVRHAEPNFNNHDDKSRELSEKGMADRRLVTDFMEDKAIDAVLSSPFKRAVDTVKVLRILTVMRLKPSMTSVSAR